MKTGKSKVSFQQTYLLLKVDTTIPKLNMHEMTLLKHLCLENFNDISLFYLSNQNKKNSIMIVNCKTQ